MEKKQKLAGPMEDCHEGFREGKILEVLWAAIRVPVIEALPIEELGRDIFVNLCRLLYQQAPVVETDTCTMAENVLKGRTVRW